MPEVVFTEKDGAFQGRLIELINGCPAGSTIRIAMYHFLYTRRKCDESDSQPDSVPCALLLAARRGVTVQILTDLRKKPETYRAFHEWMNRRLQAAQPNSWLANEPERKNHNKFVLLSNACGKSHWVIQSSENLTTGGSNKHQATVMLRDEEIFNWYSKYWEAIRDESWSTSASWRTVTHAPYRAYFFPREEKDDPFMKMFKYRAKTRKYAKKGEILVCMPRWSKKRADIATHLLLAHIDGWKVQVITRKAGAAGGNSVDGSVLAKLGGVPVKAVKLDKLNIHSKYILLRGYYGKGKDSKKRKRWLTWTGAENFTGAALTQNYEAMVRIESKEVRKAYKANFRMLWEQIPG